MKKSFTTYQAINSLTAKSACFQGVSSSFQRLRQTKPKNKQQLLRDYEQFARRMILLYIYHGQNVEPHPFHVKTTWISQVQHSVALESYLGQRQ